MKLAAANKHINKRKLISTNKKEEKEKKERNEIEIVTWDLIEKLIGALNWNLCKYTHIDVTESCKLVESEAKVSIFKN